MGDDLETYRAIEDAYKEGKVRAIGLSNFNAPQVQEIIDNSSIKSAVDQIETHILWQQQRMHEYLTENNIVHESYAHYWPQVADQWSDLMIKLNAKPVRGNLIAEYEDYNGNLAAIFADIARATEDYRRKVIELIELAELNEDKEVVLVGEEVLLQILPYRKQADIWAVEAKRYEGNYKSFD